MRQATSIILALTVISLSSVAGADVIRGATAVLLNEPGNGVSTVIGGYIDQSGLQANYISGTTDFDTYDPTSVANTGTGSAHCSVTNLGAETRISIWVCRRSSREWPPGPFPQSTPNQTGVFQVYVSDDPTFATAGPLDTFTILDNGSGNESFGQVFDIPDTQGQYVRIDHIFPIGSGTYVGGGEIAFATTSAVPEPAAANIVWLTLFGMAWMLRRKRS